MVKNKDSIFSYLKVFYNFKIFSKDIEIKKAIIYCLIYLFLISIFSYIKNSFITKSIFNGLESLILSFFGVILMILVVYSLIFLFINSYDKTKRKFFEGFLVFSLISLPFLVIGHLINIIILYTYYNLIITILSIFITILWLYLVIVLIINLKNFYNISIFKIIASLLFTFIFLSIIIILWYLTYLISLTN